jgi:hypothetical protein
MSECVFSLSLGFMERRWAGLAMVMVVVVVGVGVGVGKGGDGYQRGWW